MPKRGKKSRKGKKRNGNRGNQPARWRGPRTYTVGRFVNMHIRYYSIAAQTDTITGKNLLNCLAMAATTTTSYRIFSALKIKRFDLWSPPSMATTGVGVAQPGVSLEWYQVTGTAFTNSTKIGDTSEPGKPAFISCRPPRGSSQSFWISSGGALDTTDTIIAITTAIGTVIDFYFKACLIDDDTVFGAEAPVAATVGKLYYDYLDGRTSGNLSPLSVNVIPSPWGPSQVVDPGMAYKRYPESVTKKLIKLQIKYDAEQDPVYLERQTALALEANKAMNLSAYRRGDVPKPVTWADMLDDEESEDEGKGKNK